MKTARLAVITLLLAGTSAATDARDSSSALSTSADLEHVLRNLDREEQALKKRLVESERESALAHARSVARGRAYVRLVRAGLLPVGGGFEALVDHATRLERLYRGLSSDLQRERRLAIERRTIAEKLEALRARREPLQTEQKPIADAQAAVLAAEERRMAFQSAFASSSDPAHAAVYGGVLGPSESRDGGDGFAALRGRLPFPITGRAEVRSGRRASSDGPGLEMRAPAGTAVRAVFSGRVAFADAYSDYGHTVIVDHGGRHYTVSANLGTIDIKVGDEVSSGERIGSVGGGSGGAMLYFEVRIGQDTVDPAEWLGL